MSGESNGAPASYGALLRAIDGLRDDVREDLGALEGRVMAAITEVQRDAHEYAIAHSGIHADDHAERDRLVAEAKVAHDRFDDFIRNAALAQARRDGALGVIRFVIELVGRNWRGVAAVAGALIVALLTVTGQLSVSVSVR